MKMRSLILLGVLVTSCTDSRDGSDTSTPGAAAASGLAAAFEQGSADYTFDPPTLDGPIPGTVLLSQDGTSRYLCGLAFAIPLRPGEEADTKSPMEDFIVHTVRAKEGQSIIYEGNHPEEGGRSFSTGFRWPNVVVVHEADGAPAISDDIAGRVVLGEERPLECRQITKVLAS